MKSPLTLAASLWVASFLPLTAQPGHLATDAGAQQQKLIVVEYAGFDCAPCAEVAGLLEKLVREKKLSLQVVFKNAPTTPDGLLAHEAALAAGQQGKFWEMHDLLFTKPKANYSEILEMGKSLKLDMKRFQTAIDEREFREKVMTDLVEGRGLGIQITPTIFLNGTKLEGIEQIRSLVERATSAAKEPDDEDRIYEFELAGSPTFGPGDAPVTIVEFSDFRCGFCGVHSRIVTELVAAYPGKIRRVFKHFPVQVNADGKLPHLGSMAAMAQGRFWEMYRALMNKPLIGRDDLISRAVAIGLDMERFERDLNAGEGAAIMQRDIEEGDRLGIRMTPTSFINGRMVSGRQTLESLKKRVDSILAPGFAQKEGKVTALADRSEEPVEPGVLIEFFTDRTDPDNAKIFSVLKEYRKERRDSKIQLACYSDSASPQSLRIQRAALAAGAQDKSWEMCELILAARNPPTEAELLGFARQLNLDTDRFAKDLGDEKLAKGLGVTLDEGKKRGMTEKSRVFVNGVRVEGVPTVKMLVELTAAGCCGIE